MWIKDKYQGRWSYARAATLLLATATLPMAVWAQTVTEAPAAPATMDHSAMKGMDHGDMKGMHQSAKKKGATKGMDRGSMQGMDHSQMNMDGMKGMDHGTMDKGAMQGMDHSQMDMGGMKGMDHGAMNMGAMQGGSAPADARDPDAYSDGLTSGPMPGMDMRDDTVHAQLLVDRLEATHSNDVNGQALDAQFWFGGDLNRLWINLEAERSGGHLESTRTEAFWDRAISTYWNLQTGVRHDSGAGPGRTWAALGVRGLAPYWFELQATAYVGESGRTAARFEAEYDVLFTQRLILQPRVEINAYGKSDPARGLGSGVSNLEAGVRLRYEISRKFAPYVGVSWGRKFGGTADYARKAGEDASETRWVAGVKFWF